MKKLFAIILCILLGIPAYADIAYEPPTTTFYEEHRMDCSKVERQFYTNGEKGYITLRETPGGLIQRYITNAKCVEVFCTYSSNGTVWAMISHLDSAELSTPGWVEYGELYLIYDEQSFREEHADELGSYDGTLVLPEGAEGFYIYNYPGAGDPWLYDWFEEGDDLGLGSSYTDPQGRLWGRIGYYRGIRNQWVCISDPCTQIEPFGGDPKLELFQTTEDPEILPDEALTLDEPIASADPVVIPAEEPPAVVFNPLPWLAAGLVLLAVAAAVILLAVCYKKKKKE